MANDNTPEVGDFEGVSAPRSPAEALAAQKMAVFPPRRGTSVLCADARLFRWRAVGRAAKPMRSGWRCRGFGTAFPGWGMPKAKTVSPLPKRFAHSFRK